MTWKLYPKIECIVVEILTYKLNLFSNHMRPGDKTILRNIRNICLKNTNLQNPPELCKYVFIVPLVISKYFQMNPVALYRGAYIWIYTHRNLQVRVTCIWHSIKCVFIRKFKQGCFPWNINCLKIHTLSLYSRSKNKIYADESMFILPGNW